MKIGLWLLEQRNDRKLIGFLSKQLGVTPKTLRNWRAMAKKGGPARIGRPPYPKSLREHAMRTVKEQLELQGYPGWRPIAAALPDIPVRIVQECVRLIKAAQRQKMRKLREQNRITTRVLAREAIWSMDGTLVHRRGSQDAQVIKDRGTLAYRAVRAGAMAHSADAVRLLQEAKHYGGLPLVLSTDNGSLYCSQETEAFLEKEKIVHLRSLPRTPQHNGAAEIGIREAKEALPVHCADYSTALLNTCEAINKHRLRATKGFKSAAKLDEEMAVAYNQVNREEFYARCMDRVRRAQQLTLSRHKRRRAEREAILMTLDEYQLIKRTRGGRPYRAENVEIFL